MNARSTSHDRLLPVRSAPIAAHLSLAGHAVLLIRHDARLGRDVFYFAAATAQRDFDRFMLALDTLRADAERAATGGRR